MSRLKANNYIQLFLITAMFGLTSISSCAQQNQGQAPESATECTPLAGYGYSLVQSELTQQLLLFSTKHCENGSKISEIGIEPDTRPIAIWNDLILLDQGSDESSHELLVATFSGEILKSLSFIGEVEPSTEIAIYKPTEEEAAASACPNQQEAQEWERFGFVILKAKAQKISRTLEVTETNDFTCYALN